MKLKGYLNLRIVSIEDKAKHVVANRNVKELCKKIVHNKHNKIKVVGKIYVKHIKCAWSPIFRIIK